MAAIWLREEFMDREDELETRTQFEQRTGVSAMSLSSHFTRYANRVPGVVKKFGKQKFFVSAELDEFIAWIAENSGNRSEAEVRRSEVARLKNSVTEAEKRVADRRRDAKRAEEDLAKFRRQLKSTESELAFLEQAEKSRNN